jgi:hypothetical protein
VHSDFPNTLYKILIEFGVPMKLIRLIKMCLNAMYGRARVRKHLHDVLTIKNVLKQGDALSPLLFKFAVGYAIRKLQLNQDSMK